jgi:hypothetical protein
VQREASSQFEEAVGRLNALYFFNEFTFSTNTFKPNPADELELADKVVWLDDLLILSQIKERNAPQDTTAAKEKTWFREEVLKHATRQIRNTLAYLTTYPNIELCNNRGDPFNLARAQVAQTHKLVIYNPHPLLPVECAREKFHQSKTTGANMHLIHAGAYLGILRTLITPVEIAEYLTFRESLLGAWGTDALAEVNEKALVGQYLRNLPNENPNASFERFVDEVNTQSDEWDISKMIHLFPERRTTPNARKETGYTVLRALAKLYRTDMAQFKQRFKLSMEKAIADEGCLPYRFVASTGCGFVFIPLQRKDLPRRGALLEALTELGKYDLKLEKCIGLTFIAEGNDDWCDVQWCPIVAPWKENAVLQNGLDKIKPFRPVKEHRVERYGLRPAQDSETGE